MDAEITRNAEEFRGKLLGHIQGNIGLVLEKNTTKIDNAYGRLTALQAVRSYLLDSQASEGALGFFTEAQGDGLTSIVLILSGSSRSALKSLRSLIENIVRSIYYADHPVEYRLWECGRHRPTFKSLFDYIAEHPDFQKLGPAAKSAINLHSTWKKLSQSVHASAKEERMSDKAGEIIIWKTTQKAVGEWSNYQKSVLTDVSYLYLALFASKLQGAALKAMREALSITLPAKTDAEILKNLGVKIPRD